jgi:hypothetical protein
LAAEDPRYNHIPKSLREGFIEHFKSEELERILVHYQHEAERKANQPKRFWEIWKR